MATTKRSKARGRTDKGADARTKARAALRNAWQAWLTAAACGDQRDRTTADVADVLATLFDATARPTETSATIRKLGAVSRKYMGEFYGMDRGQAKSRPEVIAQIAEAVRCYGAKRLDTIPAAIVLDMGMSFAFTPFSHGDAIARVTAILEALPAPLSDQDVEDTVRNILVAYGLSRDDARNALKFLDVKSARTGKSTNL